MAPPRIVLLRPRNADNLGAIARAMKNFGLTDWVVVSPNPQLMEAPGLNRLAVHAGDLLENVKIVATFAEAVTDCSWVVGTTMRFIEGRKRFTPRELTAEVMQRNDEKWALVFGDERHGMTNEDLEQCHALSFIPSSDEQPSLNLAQAVIVYGYELAMGRRGEVQANAPTIADDAMVRQLKTSLQLGLTASGFLRDADDDRHAVEDLLASLLRGRLTKKEAGLWIAAWRVVAKRTNP
jgi:TrmH family RNA methyltransferase